MRSSAPLKPPRRARVPQVLHLSNKQLLATTGVVVARLLEDHDDSVVLIIGRRDAAAVATELRQLGWGDGSRGTYR